MQKEETRRNIIAEAYSLFGLKGYEKTTMRELADRAEVGLGTIFRHFPDKPSLLISTFREDLETIVQNSMDTMPATNIKMQLAHVVTELYAFFGHNPSFSRALIKETLFIQESPAEKQPGLVLALTAKIEYLFESAIERAEIHHKTDCRSGALAFLSFFLLGLVAGLQEPTFDVKKQTLFFASLLENYFTGALKLQK